MSARRCNPCSACWPVSLKIGDRLEQFLVCPECEGKTDFFSNTDAMDNDEARSRFLHAAFDKYYAEHAAKQLANEIDGLNG